MRPAVLHVAQPAEAGVPRVAGDYVLDQHARGWRVGVAAPVGGELDRRIAGTGVRSYPWTAAREPWKGVLTEGRRLQRIIADFRPDVVHLHSAKAGLVGRLVLRGRVPTVFQPHAWSFLAVEGPVCRATLRWERLAARWSDEILCVSAAERRLGERMRIRAAWRVVPNGVDVERHRTADRAAARRRLGLADGPIAVCVGRLSRQKGQDLLLSTWAEVRRDVPGATLALVGDGPLQTELESLAPTGVSFVGAVTDAREWYAACDVVVVPSRWEAGVPLVALEAMAVGRMLVIADVAGVRDALARTPVLVVAPECADELRRALVETLRDRAEADRRGTAARSFVEQHFDVRRSTDAVADLVVALAHRDGGGVRGGTRVVH